MSDKRHDVELKCQHCGHETLATDGCWDPACWKCDGRRVVTTIHDHLLSYAEMRALGYSLGPVGAPPKETS